MANILNNGVVINTDYQYAKLISRTIEKVVIPSNISTIGYAAFQYCSSIKELYVPKNIKTISSNAFDHCSSLEKLEFADNSISTLSQNVFANCTALTEVRIPYGVASMSGASFGTCTALRKVSMPETFTQGQYAVFQNDTSLAYIFFRGNTIIRYNTSNGLFTGCTNVRLFDMRYMLTAKDKASGSDLTANNVYLYINVPDNLYDEFVALPNWSALNLKRWVHSCDVATFNDIQNPIENHYYSLKGDTNYLNPLGEKQIDIRQYSNGAWVEVDIDA